MFDKNLFQLKLFYREIRTWAAEQFFQMATKCNSGNRPLLFFITLLFTVLSVSVWLLPILIYLFFRIDFVIV